MVQTGDVCLEKFVRMNLPSPAYGMTGDNAKVFLEEDEKYNHCSFQDTYFTVSNTRQEKSIVMEKEEMREKSRECSTNQNMELFFNPEKVSVQTDTGGPNGAKYPTIYPPGMIKESPTEDNISVSIEPPKGPNMRGKDPPPPAPISLLIPPAHYYVTKGKSKDNVISAIACDRQTTKSVDLRFPFGDPNLPLEIKRDIKGSVSNIQINEVLQNIKENLFLLSKLSSDLNKTNFPRRANLCAFCCARKKTKCEVTNRFNKISCIIAGGAR